MGKEEINSLLAEFCNICIHEFGAKFPIVGSKESFCSKCGINIQDALPDPNFFDPITGMGLIFKWVVPEMHKRGYILLIESNEYHTTVFYRKWGENRSHHLYASKNPTEALANACVALVEKLKCDNCNYGKYNEIHD